MRNIQSKISVCFYNVFLSNKKLTFTLLTSPPIRVQRQQDLLSNGWKMNRAGSVRRPVAAEKKKGEIKMIPYGFGFEPNDYNARLDLQIDFKALGRSCKALVKKVGRRIRHKTDK
jgi:hypothetical protein